MSDTITKPNRRILPGQFASAEYQRQDLIIRPERGTQPSELLEPAYWANVAKLMRPFDRIEVRPTDEAYWAELLVRAVEPFAAKVMFLRYEDLLTRGPDGAAIAAPEGYDYRIRGTNRWSAIRLEDGVVLRDGESSREGIDAWLRSHLRRLAPG